MSSSPSPSKSGKPSSVGGRPNLSSPKRSKKLGNDKPRSRSPFRTLSRKFRKSATVADDETFSLPSPITSDFESTQDSTSKPTNSKKGEMEEFDGFFSSLDRLNSDTMGDQKVSMPKFVETFTDPSTPLASSHSAPSISTVSERTIAAASAPVLPPLETNISAPRGVWFENHLAIPYSSVSSSPISVPLSDPQNFSGALLPCKILDFGGLTHKKKRAISQMERHVPFNSPPYTADWNSYTVETPNLSKKKNNKPGKLKPIYRNNGSAVYDKARHTIYLFGGENEKHQDMKDLFELNLNNENPAWKLVRANGFLDIPSSPVHSFIHNDYMYVYSQKWTSPKAKGKSAARHSQPGLMFRINTGTFTWEIVTPLHGSDAFAPPSDIPFTAVVWDDSLIFIGIDPSRNDKPRLNGSASGSGGKNSIEKPNLEALENETCPISMWSFNFTTRHWMNWKPHGVLPRALINSSLQSCLIGSTLLIFVSGLTAPDSTKNNAQVQSFRAFNFNLKPNSLGNHIWQPFYLYSTIPDMFQEDGIFSQTKKSVTHIQTPTLVAPSTPNGKLKGTKSSNSRPGTPDTPKISTSTLSPPQSPKNNPPGSPSSVLSPRISARSEKPRGSIARTIFGTKKRPDLTKCFHSSGPLPLQNFHILPFGCDNDSVTFSLFGGHTYGKPSEINKSVYYLRVSGPDIGMQQTLSTWPRRYVQFVGSKHVPMNHKLFDALNHANKSPMYFPLLQVRCPRLATKISSTPAQLAAMTPWEQQVVYYTALRLDQLHEPPTPSNADMALMTSLDNASGNTESMKAHRNVTVQQLSKNVYEQFLRYICLDELPHPKNIYEMLVLWGIASRFDMARLQTYLYNILLPSLSRESADVTSHPQPMKSILLFIKEHHNNIQWRPLSSILCQALLPPSVTLEPLVERRLDFIVENSPRWIIRAASKYAASKTIDKNLTPLHVPPSTFDDDILKFGTAQQNRTDHGIIRLSFASASDPFVESIKVDAVLAAINSSLITTKLGELTSGTPFDFKVPTDAIITLPLHSIESVQALVDYWITGDLPLLRPLGKLASTHMIDLIHAASRLNNSSRNDPLILQAKERILYDLNPRSSIEILRESHTRGLDELSETVILYIADHLKFIRKSEVLSLDPGLGFQILLLYAERGKIFEPESGIRPVIAQSPRDGDGRRRSIGKDRSMLSPPTVILRNSFDGAGTFN